MNDAGLLLALLAVPLAAALFSFVLSDPSLLHGISVAAQLVTTALAFTLIGRLLAGGSVSAFDRWLYLDKLGAVVLLIVAVVSVAAAAYSVGYLGHELRAEVVGVRELRKYLALFHLFVFTMLLVTVAGNLGLLWTAVSATTLASAPLVDFYGSHEPLEAAWKYVVLTVAGSLIALLGFLLLYQSATGVLGTSYDFSFPVLAGSAPRLATLPAGAGFLLVLVGFGTKAGLAPMHSWLPDAHSQAPSPICAMLSAAELNCGMLGILRVYALAAPAVGGGALRAGLLAFGLLSMLVGVLFLIAQRDFKRLLAYSSIEQMGLISIGVSVGAPLAVVGALLQMVNHAFSKALMFFVTGNLLLGFRSTAIGAVRGAVRQMPATTLLLLAGGLGIAGAPPFGLFISEFSIVSGALGARQWAVGAGVALLLLVGFLALMAHFNRMAFDRPTEEGPVAQHELGVTALIPSCVLLGAILILGIWVPGPLHDLLAGAAKELSP